MTPDTRGKQTIIELHPRQRSSATREHDKKPGARPGPNFSTVAQPTFAAAGRACRCWAAECPGSAADLEQARLASAARKMRLEYLS